MIVTILASFLVLIGGICLLIHFLTDDYNDNWWFISGIFLVVGGIIFLVCIVGITTKEIRASAYIVKFEAVRQTFEIARVNENVNPYEIAAIQHKVAEKNEDLANSKFWTEHPLSNWFWSKRILEIEPIK